MTATQIRRIAATLAVAIGVAATVGPTGAAPIGVAASAAPSPETAASLSGTASFVGPRLGPRYLALPEGPGVRVRVCGAGGCITRTSTDAGPDRAMQRRGRIADLSFADFRLLCSCDPWVVGLQRVTVEYLAPAELPATDMEG